MLADCTEGLSGFARLLLQFCSCTQHFLTSSGNLRDMLFVANDALVALMHGNPDKWEEDSNGLLDDVGWVKDADFSMMLP